jgi:putative hydrolase of the HAD superfamily
MSAIAAEVRAVIFDYAGVMTTAVSMPGGPSEKGSHDAKTEVQADVDQSTDLRTALRRMMGRELRNPDPNGVWNRLERGEISFRTFSDALDAEHSGVANFFRESGGHLMSSLALRDEMVEIVRLVRSQGLATALLTNNVAEWRPLWRAKLEEADALDLFDVIVDSSEVGMRKPEPRIYHHTLSQLGVAAHEALFIDDFEQNVRGGREVGLHVLQATADDQHLTALRARFG